MHIVKIQYGSVSICIWWIVCFISRWVFFFSHSFRLHICFFLFLFPQLAVAQWLAWQLCCYSLGWASCRNWANSLWEEAKSQNTNVTTHRQPVQDENVRSTIYVTLGDKEKHSVLVVIFVISFHLSSSYGCSNISSHFISFFISSHFSCCICFSYSASHLKWTHFWHRWSLLVVLIFNWLKTFCDFCSIYSRARKTE